MSNDKSFYSVEFWESNPDLDNDDCGVGCEFATSDEADAFFDAPEAVAQSNGWAGVLSTLPTSEYIVLSVRGDDGEFGEIDRRKNPKFDRADAEAERAADDAEWKREQATQAGMVFGCQGCNDVMGY